MTKLIGQSLSKCVADIAEGYVAYEDVVRIVAGTRHENPEAAISAYMQNGWEYLPEPKKSGRHSSKIIR